MKKKSKPRKKRKTKAEQLREERFEQMDWEWRKAWKLVEEIYARQIKRMVIV